MNRLTAEQLENIERLSNTVVTSRTQLAEGLCEALGDGWSWGNGFVNGHGNSIVLVYENRPIQIGTYKFADGVAIKFICTGEYDYYFDKLGKVTGIYRHYEEQIDERTTAHKIEKVQ